MNYPYCSIGLDIGGTKIAAGLVVYNEPDIEPEVKYACNVASEAKKDKQTVLNNIFSAADLVIDEAHKNNFDFKSTPLVCIGLACAGRCNKNSGVITSGTVNFADFEDVHIVDLFEERYGVTASVLNDVQSYALGEAR